MKRTYIGVVENGQIKLPEGIDLPDQTKVLIVLTATGGAGHFTIASGDDSLPLIRTTEGV